MATNAIFPIELKQVIFTNINIFSIPEHVPKADIRKTETQLNNNLNIEVINQELKEYAVSMTSQFNLSMDPAEPYAIDISCMGVFSVVDPSISEDELMKALTITGHSVVYGAIRETVSWITSRSIYGAFIFGISVLKPQPKLEEKLD